MSRKEERLNQVVDILKKRNSATIKELAILLDVSEMTIRRDMEMLKAKGIILDIPGVAVLNVSAADEADKYLLSMATTFHAKEK